jgi:hypothetical protein
VFESKGTSLLNKLLNKLWLKLNYQEQSTQSTRTELMPIKRTEAVERKTSPLAQSVIYRIKKNALFIVAEMNRGTIADDCSHMARQLAFVQKELIQAAYHDENIPKVDKLALAKYHALNIRQGIGERREQPLRGVK